ncbi:MAG: 16S rRNA (cytosine(1402)-N(4))-methyltransferase RsmH [Campylobacterales bacterium]
MSTIPHIPVLASQTVTLFEGAKPGVLVDCTVGYGGHAELLLTKFPQLSYIGIDRDETAVRFAAGRLAPFGDRFRVLKGAFSEVLPTLTNEPLSGILADLGVSSLQLDRVERGFGFASEVLDMRMDQSRSLNASVVVNEYDESRLTEIFKTYGEEPFAYKMARLIVQSRPFSSAKALADLITSRFPKGRIHPATRIFQAIRIEVNDELGELRRLLDTIESLARPDLRVGIISFHSLEDRMVKERFKAWSQACVCPPGSWRCTCGANHALGYALTKKPWVATEEEIDQNPRSRSAKLRGFCFTRSAGEY